MNVPNTFLSTLLINSSIFTITPIHASSVDDIESNNVNATYYESAHTWREREEQQKLTAEQKASELWQSLINNKTQDIQKALSEYTENVLTYTSQTNIDFQTQEDELLKIFPHSPEHLLAIAETYLTLPDVFKNPLVTTEEDNIFGPNVDTTIYDPTFNKKKALDRFVKAFNLSKQQEKNELAATIAIRIANILNGDLNAFHHISSNIFSQGLTPIEEDPCLKDRPRTKEPAIYRFQVFQTPPSWEEAKSDGERVLWLFQEAKSLNPQCKNEVDRIWANLMRTWFAQYSAVYSGDIVTNTDYQIRKKLKINEYYLPNEILGISEEESQQGRVLTLTGVNDFIQVYRNLLKDDPKQSDVAHYLAMELWNRGMFTEAKEVMEECLKHISNEDKEKLSRTCLFLNDISRPCIRLYNKHDHNKISQEPLANNDIPILARYCNSPKDILTIDEIDLVQVYKDAFDELKTITDPNEHTRKIGNLTYDSLWESTIKPQKDRYCKQITEISSNFSTPRPNEWFDEEIKLPINKEGIYAIEGKNNTVKYPLFVRIDPFNYLVRNTIEGFECIGAYRDTGKPLAKAQGLFYVYMEANGKMLQKTIECVSDDMGIFKIKMPFENVPDDNINQKYVHIAGFISKGDKKGVIEPARLECITNSNQKQLSEKDSDKANNLQSIYCQFDRPVYFPGDTIKGQGIISNYDNSFTDGASSKELLIETSTENWFDPFEKINHKITKTQNEFGIIDFEIPLPKTSKSEFNKRSQLRVQIMEKDSNYFDSFNIDVENEEIDKSPINITIKNNKIEYGKPITIGFEASESSDEIPQGSIKYMLTCQEDEYESDKSPMGHWMQHELGTDDFNMERRSTTLAMDILSLDDDGQATFSYHHFFPLKPKSTKQFRSFCYQITGSYTNEEDQSFTIEKTYRISNYPLLLIDYPSSTFATQGKPYHITWEAHSVMGIDINKVKGTIQLIRSIPNPEATPWYHYFVPGDTNQDHTIDDIIQTWTVTTDVKGKATLDFTPTISGEYHLKGTWIDQDGGVSYTDTPLYIVGDNIQSPFQSLEIIPSKREYAPNEEIELLITAPSDGGTIWFDMKAGTKKQTTQTYSIDKGYKIIRIKPDKSDWPNFEVMAAHAHERMRYTQQKSIWILPDLKNLDIETSITTDTDNPQKGHLNVQVQGENGEPIANAQLFISIYDANLDKGEPSRSFNVMFPVWEEVNRASDIKTITSYSLFSLRTYIPIYFKSHLNDSYSYGGDINRDKKSKMPYIGRHYPSKPRNFDKRNLTPDLPNAPIYPPYDWGYSLLFSSEIQTDAQGKASIPFNLPLESSSWRIKVKAHTKDLKEGYTQKLWNFEKSN